MNATQLFQQVNPNPAHHGARHGMNTQEKTHKGEREPESREVRVGDLQDQFGTPYPRSILLCSFCGNEYSAHKGDYFTASDNTVLKCCDIPMLLVTKHETYELVH